MPIEQQPVKMTPPPDRAPKRLHLSDVELWCQEMRARGARDDVPFKAQISMGGWVKVLEAAPGDLGGIPDDL